jgi:DNA-directed RNA polymerase sigma subunit (sigma70/sigma32)
MMLMASLSHSYEEMGQNLDVSRQRIEQILRKLGIKPKVKAILQKNRQRLKGGR